MAVCAWRADDLQTHRMARHADGAGDIDARQTQQRPGAVARGSAGQGLWERVREKEGLSYGVGASLAAPWDGNAGAININASFAPQNRRYRQDVGIPHKGRLR